MTRDNKGNKQETEQAAEKSKNLFNRVSKAISDAVDYAVSEKKDQNENK
jgi:hypothetical protein